MEPQIIKWALTIVAKNMKWKIYYGNGTTFCDEEGAPIEAPIHGVACIVCANKDHGRIMLQGWDWYYFKEDDWWGSDDFGLLDQMMHYAPLITALKQGRTYKNSVFEEILKQATFDLYVPKRTASYKKEIVSG